VLATRDGQRVLSQGSKTDPRVINLSLRVSPSSLGDRRTKLNTLLAALSGKIEIVAVDDATKLCYGYLVSGETTFPHGPGLATLTAQHDVSLVCFDPLWYDVTPQVVGLAATGTPYSIPQGSASMRRWQVYVYGAASSPWTLTMKNAAGDTLASMTVATALSSSEYAIVDGDSFTITKFSGGVSSDITSTLSATHDFFRLDPWDAPTLQIDKGSAVVYASRPWVA